MPTKCSAKIIFCISTSFEDDDTGSCIDALEKIKKKYPKDKIIFCNGGDRDKDKRPIMGKISSDLSSRVIFTSDNPRSEDPKSIINDMVQGVSNFNSNKISIELERKKAIRKAKENSNEGDIVLITG